MVNLYFYQFISPFVGTILVIHSFTRSPIFTEMGYMPGIALPGKIQDAS